MFLEKSGYYVITTRRLLDSVTMNHNYGSEYKLAPVLDNDNKLIF